MQIGKLRNYVSLQRAGEVQDGNGEMIPGWPEVIKLWADIRFQTGLQAVNADAQTSIAKVSIRIRQRAGVVATMRIVDAAGVIYSIDAVLPNKQSREFMDLVCTQGANND